MGALRRQFQGQKGRFIDCALWRTGDLTQAGGKACRLVILAVIIDFSVDNYA
jgi:hypothetical protein